MSDFEVGPSNSLTFLKHLIDQLARLLPAQGPITVFVALNTLEAFEDLPFDQAVQAGGRIFGCHPYLTEDRFRQKMARGRIRLADLEVVLRDDLGTRADESILSFGSRYSFRLAMLKHRLWSAPAAELRWFIAQTDALTLFRSDVALPVHDRLVNETRHWLVGYLSKAQETNGHVRNCSADKLLASIVASFDETNAENWTDETWERFTLQALWQICRAGVENLPPADQPPASALRHRDALLQATGEDSDLVVHDLLIRFCAAFLDQGLSQWPLPQRNLGFFEAFRAIYGSGGGPPDRWLAGLSQELARLQATQIRPMDSIRESLELLGVPEEEWEPYLTATFVALRGWSGMIHQMEIRGDRVAHRVPEGTLVEFLAVRLILERLALARIAQDAMGFQGSLRDLRSAACVGTVPPEQTGPDQRAFLVFQLAQIMGWLPSELARLQHADWTVLVREIETFSDLERRRIFQMAFERGYRIKVLDAVSAHVPHTKDPNVKPRFQVVTCLDEREESFRRHLEELAPNIETFGVAGFFAVVMYFRGVADAHYVPLCPVVIRPKHWVEEDVVYSFEESHQLRGRLRRTLGKLTHGFHVGSRTGAGGAILAAGVGALASIPLVARVLFPRMTARIRKTASKLVQAPRLTQLQLERSSPIPSPESDGQGFTVPEMADIAERLLRDIGLTSQFAKLVILLGHGSHSANNPHKSAYDCGACCGYPGGPNARAAAQILNNPVVRDLLNQRGLPIPKESYFVGGLHNTCSDSVTYFDLDRLPKSHQLEFRDFHEIQEKACDRNAHERCRRFYSAPLTLSYSAARRHVENRSEDLAQTRPEYGHATNAICFVGRRERTRGLFMDRRCFLTSYDPLQDTPDHAILTRTLQAAVPVCSGINLVYYFSSVDSPGWGCGTKLPHNVTSLIGVMDGAASDLRTGLPLQQVEIHEPLRLLFVIETTPEAMLLIMERNEVIRKICRNGWVQVAVLDPHSSEIQELRGDVFVPYDPETSIVPKAESSFEWYRGQRDHLGFAILQPRSRN